MTKLYLIDDDHLRHQKLTVLVDILNKSLSTQEYECAICPSEEADARVHAAQSIEPENVWTAVSTADTHSIFLIDLKLGNLEENQAKADLDKLLQASSYVWKDEAINLLSHAGSTIDWSYKTALFACAVLKARGIAIIIVSTATTVDEVTTFAQEFSIPYASLKDVQNGLGPKSGQGSAYASELERLILALRRHTDPVIQGILRSYFEPLSTELHYWRHGVNEAFDGSHLGKGIWGLGEIDEPTNKALHCRGDDWQPRDRDLGSITWGCLENVISVLEFRCPVNQVGLTGDRFYFPIKPGILFLLSLRELLVAMTSDNDHAKPRPWPTGIKFGRTKKLMFVSIELNSDNSSEIFMLKRFLGKPWRDYKTHNGTISNRLPDGGLSESIFHLGHSRLSGINGNEPWSMMFKDGSKDWVAWPSFQNNSITFHWHI